MFSVLHLDYAVDVSERVDVSGNEPIYDHRRRNTLGWAGIGRADHLLLCAAIPALIGSLLLMRTAGVGGALLVQQVVVSGLSFAAAVALPRLPRGKTLARAAWVVAAAVILVWTPLWWRAGDEPRRWLSWGGLRIYVAAMVLPPAIVLLARALHSTSARPVWPQGAIAAVGAALAAQPDASQATAFALACGIPLCTTPGRPSAKAVMFAALVTCAVWAWRQPDPLLPVPHVEGVLDLARAAGPLALATAVASLALPPVALVLLSNAFGDAGLLAVAIYFGAVDALAWFQLTPMPLLGFGAGPILGYVAMVLLAPRWDESERPARAQGDST